MAFEKLNHTKVLAEMYRLKMRPSDLAKRLKISRQLANYVIYKGGRKHAFRLAKLFGCKKEDLIVANIRTPKKFTVVNGMVKKKDITP